MVKLQIRPLTKVLPQEKSILISGIPFSLCSTNKMTVFLPWHYPEIEKYINKWKRHRFNYVCTTWCLILEASKLLKLNIVHAFSPLS